MAKQLAIIGCGPKAAAIAAKAQAMRLEGLAGVPDITIYDGKGAAANWSGLNGYTDGSQPLCTLAERDLGYPYDLNSFGPRVAARMLAEFSWQRFAIVSGQGNAQYDEWVMHGRRPPSHADFAEYISSAVHRSGAALIAADAAAIDYDKPRGLWLVEDASGIRRLHDGVVITGSGPPIRPFAGANNRVFDGISFWLRQNEIIDLLERDPDPSLAIIGAGGTAAAIAHWFVRNRIFEFPITIIGREATLFSRSPSLFEDRLFTDSDAWNLLAPHTKDAFVRRLTQGVVWDYVIRGLTDADNLAYESYAVRQFLPAEGTPPPDTDPYVQAELFPPPGGPPTADRNPAGLKDATVFIDARGFNAWWFVDTLFERSDLSSVLRSYKDGIRETITNALSVAPAVISRGGFPPGLHLPMHASAQGPAAPNLMALGWMADRILRAYVMPPPRSPAAAIP